MNSLPSLETAFKQQPIPLPEASVSNMKVSDKDGKCKTGGRDNLLFA